MKTNFALQAGLGVVVAIAFAPRQSLAQVSAQVEAGVNISIPVGAEWRLEGVGDVDGDRTADIVWRHDNGQVHYWPMAHGQRVAGLNISTPVGSEWRLEGVGDVDGDSDDDIVWQHANGQAHYWRMGVSQPTSLMIPNWQKGVELSSNFYDLFDRLADVVPVEGEIEYTYSGKVTTEASVPINHVQGIAWSGTRFKTKL